MDLKVGWLGLANSGKTTIVNLLLGQNDESSPVSQSTDQPKAGLKHWMVSDIKPLLPIINPAKLFYVDLELIDICGFIEGTGEEHGLAARHLAAVRGADVLAIVLRMFEDETVSYTVSSTDWLASYNALLRELVLIDKKLLEARLAIVAKRVQFGQKDLAPELELIKNCIQLLGQGYPLSNREFSDDEIKILDSLNLLSHKPKLAIVNIGEQAAIESRLDDIEAQVSAKLRIPSVAFCASLEREMVNMTPEEWSEFRDEFGGYESRIELVWKRILQASSRVVYVTFGHLGLKCWIMPKGMTLLDAAKRMHSDFAKNLAGGEVYRIDEIVAAGSLEALSKTGIARLRPKHYVVQDLDILYFRTTT